MKKILAAAMVFVGGAAFAQVDATEVDDAAKEMGQTTKENVKELGKQAGMVTADQGTFKEAKAFKIKGEIKQGGRGEITLARQGLPDAVLDIRGETKIFVDGKKAEADMLKEGMKIDAKFQLEGEESVAVHVHAKSPKRGMGGAGEAGMKADDKAEKKMHEGKQEMKEGAHEMKHDAQEMKDDAKY